MWVKFESIYTESDRYGNTRRLENRFEAEGAEWEISNFIANLPSHIRLPGTSSIDFQGLLGAGRTKLLEDI